MLAETGERLALLGSAYKRLAWRLSDWSSADGTADQPRGRQQALEQSARWYGIGEGDPDAGTFSSYNCHNRLALEAVLGTARPENAELALRAGELARARYATSRDSWDLIMAGDGLLIARLIDGSLADPARATGAEREIVDRYAGLREQLPESARQTASVVDQVRLLADLIEMRPAADAAAQRELIERLRRIEASLQGSA
jgi:hypothetical protein